MAETTRRSKPRKIEVAEDEEEEPRGHGIVLLAYLIGGIGVQEIMIAVASFLSAGSADRILLYAIGGTAVVAGGLFAIGKWMGRKKA